MEKTNQESDKTYLEMNEQEREQFDYKLSLREEKIFSVAEKVV